MSQEQPTLEEVGHAVHELRREVKGLKLPDPDAQARINSFLDVSEEKVFQPLARAAEEAKTHAADIAELKEKLEAAGATETEAKARIDALELEIARASQPREVRWKDGDEYKAMNQWCRDGDESSPERKDILRTDSSTVGGFLVATEMDSQITKKITEIDPIRSIARVRTIGSKSIELPIRNVIPVAQYEGEAEEGPESNATYQAETVTPFRQTFTTPITADMLMDAAFDMEAEIASDAAEAFAFGEGNGFVVGTGFKQPAGFAAHSQLQTDARTTAVSGVLDPESVILLTGDLKVGYDPVYVLNRRTLALIRTFRADAVSAADAAGQFLWAPGIQEPGASGPVANTINGFPYVLANSMPDVAAGAFAIAFGDFRRGYVIVDRTGMSVIRDEVTQKKKSIVEFTMNRWNTGRVVLQEPIKLLEIAP